MARRGLLTRVPAPGGFYVVYLFAFKPDWPDCHRDATNRQTWEDYGPVTVIHKGDPLYTDGVRIASDTRCAACVADVPATRYYT